MEVAQSFTHVITTTAMGKGKAKDPEKDLEKAKEVITPEAKVPPLNLVWFCLKRKTNTSQRTT